MRKPVTYLCVDDAGGDQTDAYLDFISDQHERLAIQLSEPEEFAWQVAHLQRVIQPAEAAGYDGLVLDLRLDGEGSKAHYRAPALAQEIHTRAVEESGAADPAGGGGEGFPVRPLALWSNDNKLDKSYWPDDTSHDLFDLTIFKEKLADLDVTYAQDMARKLVSLADGYVVLNSLRETGYARAAALLATAEAYLSLLDPRIISPLTNGLPATAVYDQARFIHRQLLTLPNSALVSSELLAARLGLDLAAVEEFDALVETLFPGARYQGVFAEGWSCWWMSLVERAWLRLPACPGPLRAVKAEKRVECLVRNTGLETLKAAAPLSFARSTTFWTICQITRKPLDPLEGYAVDKQLYPWQDTHYVSLYGKLTGGKKAERMHIDPLDVERYEEDKTNR